MTKEKIIKNVPDDGTTYDVNDFVTIKDETGVIRIKIHPADGKTTYDHIHIYDQNGNPLDGNGIPGFYKDKDVHIPLKK